MSPKVLVILAILLLIVFAGMAITMKRAAKNRVERTAETAYSINRCFIA